MQIKNINFKGLLSKALLEISESLNHVSSNGILESCHMVCYYIDENRFNSFLNKYLTKNDCEFIIFKLYDKFLNKENYRLKFLSHQYIIYEEFENIFLNNI